MSLSRLTMLSTQRDIRGKRAYKNSREVLFLEEPGLTMFKHLVKTFVVILLVMSIVEESSGFKRIIRVRIYSKAKNSTRKARDLIKKHKVLQAELPKKIIHRR